MLFKIICMFCILGVTFAGGYYPLFRASKTEQIEEGFPLGEAFASGVFLALSLTLMLPSAFHLFGKAFPDLDFPLASVIAIIFFILLLSLEHLTTHLKEKDEEKEEYRELSSPLIPVIMTVMIAIPSFFLGTALGVSQSLSAVFIFVAIMAHKGSAGFALALKMVKSTMSRPQIITLFCLFAFATPVGIVIGEDLHQYLSGYAMLIVKGAILAMASGAFLYMSTLHELRHTPLIKSCCTLKGFMFLVSGFVLTALIRFILGEAHRF